MKQQSLFETNQDKSSRGRNYWKIYIDGASRNNPGPSGAGAYIIKNDHVVEKAAYFLGKKTNNQAEYAALLIGLWSISKQHQKGDTVQIISDSQLLVHQINGVYKVRDAKLRPLFLLAKQLLASMNYDCSHVLREDNKDADELANVGVDKKIPLPKAFMELLQKNEIAW